MIFLNPAILFGLLAASIPVIIHLFNLRKLKKIEFSTLTFLKELQKNKIRKIKLKQWLLLALRTLIILFLVMAFARPTLEGLAIGGTTSAAKTSAVFILDDSFSLSLVDNNGSFFNQAKESIINLLSNLQEGDEASVLLTSDRNSEELHFSNDISGLIEKVRNLTVSNSSGSVENSLLKAARLVSESKNFNKEIYIVSDLQSSTFSKSEINPALNELTDSNVRLYTIRFDDREVNNVAITDFKLDTQIFEKGKPVTFTASVSNFSDRTVENNVASVFCNNERIAQQSFTLSSGESKQLSFEATINATGFIEAFVEIEDDEIIQDNKRFISLNIPDEIPVLILFEKESDIMFVDLALSVPGTSTSLKADKKNINQVASINLNKYKAIVLCGTSSEQNTQKIKSFINNGGGVFFMPASETTIRDYSSMLLQLGLKAPSTLAGKPNDVQNVVRFESIEFQHPVFNKMFTDEQKRKIDSPELYSYFRLTPSENSLPLIKLEDNSSFLTESTIGKGKLFILSTSPVLGWTNFPLKGFFVPLINKSVNYLASIGNGFENKLAGENIQLNENLLSAPQLKIIKPDKSEEILNRIERSENLSSSFDETDMTGNYKIVNDVVVDMFSINTDPVESDIKYLTNDEVSEYLEKIKFNGRAFFLNINEDPVKAVIQSRFGSELWRYFVITALLLAIVEMLVARNTKKDLIEVNKV